MKKWLQKWLGFNNLLQENIQIKKELSDTRLQLLECKQLIFEEINKFTDSVRIDAELGFRGNSTIVLTGVYKNRGYVEFYDLDSTEFHYLVEKLKDMKKEHLIRHVDGPLGFNFKGYFNIKSKANDFDRI